MIKYCLPGLAAAIALATPGIASAQSLNQAESFVGLSGGYHEFDIDEDLGDDFDIDTGSPIIGIVGGVDVPVAEGVFAGVEANFHLGTDVIDSEYGASVRLGLNGPNGSKYYLRGGYQEVDFDFGEIVDIDIDLDDFEEFDDFDTSEGDYLFGVGGDFRIGSGALRVNADTISFDSLRVTTGYVLTF